jgi:hypothetical protein
LARIFPFVVSGGEYAGRLSGFDWKGSDLIYLATDFMPFLLTVLVGVPLLKMCAVRSRPLLFGPGVVVGLAPFVSLFGDYFEMGSIITTRAVITVADGNTAALLALRSDDLFKLLGELGSPAALPDGAVPLSAPAALIIVSVAVIIAYLLACSTYALGSRFAAVLNVTGRGAESPSS